MLPGITQNVYVACVLLKTVLSNAQGTLKKVQDLLRVREK